MGILDNLKEKSKWSSLKYLGGYPAKNIAFYCGIRKEQYNIIIYNINTLQPEITIPKENILNLEVRQASLRQDRRIIIKIKHDGMDIELMFSALDVEKAYSTIVTAINTETITSIVPTDIKTESENNPDKEEKFYDKTWFMWVMMLTITPIGIYLLWKHKRYSKNARVALSIFFAIIFLFAVKDVNKNNMKDTNGVPQQTQEQKQEETKKDEKPDIDTMSIGDYIKSTDSNIKEVTDSLDITGYILIKYKLNSESSSAIAFNICPVLKNLQKHKDYAKVKKVGIMVMADFTNVYGENSEAKSLFFDVSKEELDKINWDNFNTKNIYKISTDLWKHRSIKD